jgi:hypothetical protein
MTTFSDQVYQLGGVPTNGYFAVGNTWFVRPGSGNDGNKGDKPSRAFATLAKALSVATADNGDVVYMISEDNSASGTTDYQSSSLDWNKDGVHLIGVNGSGNFVQQRSRIAQLSSATDVDDLFTVSANNCLIANISVFHGVDDADSVGAVKVTGERNRFYNCTFSGIGNATMDTANNFSLSVSGGAENIFEKCYIGLDTVARGTAANSEIRLESGATRNMFKDCVIATYAEANTHQFLIVPSAGLDRWTIFDHCIFMNMPTGDASGTTMTEAFDVTGGGSPDGIILLNFCTLVGATDWEAATESGKVVIRTDAGTAVTAGLTADVDAS